MGDGSTGDGVQAIMSLRPSQREPPASVWLVFSLMASAKRVQLPSAKWVQLAMPELGPVRLAILSLMVSRRSVQLPGLGPVRMGPRR
jgi:hypothetical protein